MLRRILIPLCMVFSFIPFAAHGDGPAVAASHVWIREAPAGVSVMTGYMTLENLSAQTLTLVSVTSPDFRSVIVHKRVQKNGMGSMQPVARIAIPAHQSFVLAPGGYHLMLMKPVKRLYDGDLVTLMLTFSDHSSLTIMAPVRRDQPQY
ncbi:MAG: copper chaperone PCu(A)C [Gammaproteobacteria bacterium]